MVIISFILMTLMCDSGVTYIVIRNYMLFSVKGQRVNSPIFLHKTGVLSHLEPVEDTNYLNVRKVATDSDLNAQG